MSNLNTTSDNLDSTGCLFALNEPVRLTGIASSKQSQSNQLIIHIKDSFFFSKNGYCFFLYYFCFLYDDSSVNFLCKSSWQGKNKDRGEASVHAFFLSFIYLFKRHSYREFSRLLVHSPIGFNSKSYVRVKPGAWKAL